MMAFKSIVCNFAQLSLLLLVLFTVVGNAVPSPAGLLASRSSSSSSSSFLQSYRNIIKSQTILSASSPPKISDIVYGTRCIDPNANLNDRSITEAAAHICNPDSPYFSSDFCVARSPTVIMTGRSDAALFVLSAARPEAAIVIERVAWLRCIEAARRVCPVGTFTSTCIGGATQGDVDFSLMETEGEL